MQDFNGGGFSWINANFGLNFSIHNTFTGHVACKRYCYSGKHFLATLPINFADPTWAGQSGLQKICTKSALAFSAAATVYATSPRPSLLYGQFLISRLQNIHATRGGGWGEKSAEFKISACPPFSKS
jgi:hypothetical protein